MIQYRNQSETQIKSLRMIIQLWWMMSSRQQGFEAERVVHMAIPEKRPPDDQVIVGASPCTQGLIKRPRLLLVAS